MTWEMGEKFASLLKQLAEEKPRVLIITGKNEVFCAGGDLQLLRSFAEKSFAQNKSDMQKFYSFFLSVMRFPAPVIAAVNGHAIGAGLALACACDLRIFADEGKYSFNFVKLGIHPGMGSSYLAPKLLGTSLGNKLLFTGEVWNGQECASWGLATTACPKEKVEATSLALAQDISQSAPLALQELKASLTDWTEVQKHLKKEAKAQAMNFLSQDFRETLDSIQEKRSPVFRGL